MSRPRRPYNAPPEPTRHHIDTPAGQLRVTIYHRPGQPDLLACPWLNGQPTTDQEARDILREIDHPLGALPIMGDTDWTKHKTFGLADGSDRRRRTPATHDPA